MNRQPNHTSKASIAKVTKCRFATVTEMFEFKSQNIVFEPFPGYTEDQWGIKAHNRPYIVANARLKPGQKAIEVGGAYSTLPKFLVDRFEVESWSADDFGAYSEETELWQRWGDPDKWIESHPSVTYKKTPVGRFDKSLPDDYFDLVYSVSTLEHLSKEIRVDAFRDMLRITKPGGRQIHLIDIASQPPRDTVRMWIRSKLPMVSEHSELSHWRSVLNMAGIATDSIFPSVIDTLDRQNLVESPDVVYRFYPPNDSPKGYQPSLSLIVEIEKDEKVLV